MNVISVIVGSTREGRFSERPAHWIFQHLRSIGHRDSTRPDPLKRRAGVEAMDLSDARFKRRIRAIHDWLRRSIADPGPGLRTSGHHRDAWRAHFQDA